MFDDLVTEKPPPPNRVGHCSGGIERHLTEGAVMVAYALHLLRTTDAKRVEVHPDGEHGKQFAFRQWLERQGYRLREELGTTAYGGIYRADDGREVRVHPKSGRGDVTAVTGAGTILAETKGGIVNSKHAGQVSRLRRGLCEAVGLLLATPLQEGMLQVAVVPATEVTRRLAVRMSGRVRLAGIVIALVDERGNVFNID